MDSEPDATWYWYWMDRADGYRLKAYIWITFFFICSYNVATSEYVAVVLLTNVAGMGTSAFLLKEASIACSRATRKAEQSWYLAWLATQEEPDFFDGE